MQSLQHAPIIKGTQGSVLFAMNVWRKKETRSLPQSSNILGDKDFQKQMDYDNVRKAVMEAKAMEDMG